MKIALTIIICLLGVLALLVSVIVFCCIRVGAMCDDFWQLRRRKRTMNEAQYRRGSIFYADLDPHML